eukprot:SAG11_NODE_10259_length_843_cov_1.544355_1_plen_78_part_01
MASPLGELGWRGKFQHESPEVEALRGQLQARAGIQGLAEDMIDPTHPGFAEAAANRFWRDGLVVVKDVLDPERLETIR